MNVLKPHQQSTVFTLLELNKSQREIHRITGIDRKTIRRYMAIFAARVTASANSPIPRPSARGRQIKFLHPRDHRLFRPRRPRRITSILPARCASLTGNGSKNRFACSETLRLSIRISSTSSRLLRAMRASNGSCARCDTSIPSNSTGSIFCPARRPRLTMARALRGLNKVSANALQRINAYLVRPPFTTGNGSSISRVSGFLGVREGREDLRDISVNAGRIA